jgi:hypothetical protein
MGAVREIYGVAHREPRAEVDSQKTTDAQGDVIRLECLRRRNVAPRRQHRVHLHATRRNQPASVIAVNVPTCVRYIPFTPDRELQEEGAPITRFPPGLTLQDLIDRVERTGAPYGAKGGIGLDVLQVYRTRRCPC